MKLKSNLQIKITRKIADIPAQDWYSVFPKALENYYFFKSLDESAFEQFTFFYILVYDNGVPVGAASCFLMRFPFDSTVQGPLKVILGWVKRLLPHILSPRVLLCGLPMGQGRIGIAGDPVPVLEAICAGMETIAKEEKAAVFIFKDFNRADADTLRPLLKKGFLKIESLPSTEMDINFSSFEDYLKTLSRASRDGLKRKFKKVDAGPRIELEITGALEGSVLSEAHGLYLQTLTRMDLGFERVPEDFFRHIPENMPEEARYFLWRIKGRIVAFAFCLVSGGYFIDYYLGFDYAVAYQYHLYFIRFRDLMRWCIANGVKKYEMGVTTYEPKRRLGFNFVRLYFYIKHRNKLINPFVKIIGSFIKPENFDPVFKMMESR
ncbi:MAG: GNAT family N-acetyltransferase [Candidatus Omnitrophota bacterium]|nr:GNAT family N-acetyltransferase [Candidatus Omnitrophota bacterium]